MFTYRFCYDSHRRYIDLDLYKNTYVVGTLNALKPLSRRTVSKCLPISALKRFSDATQLQSNLLCFKKQKNTIL